MLNSEKKIFWWYTLYVSRKYKQYSALCVKKKILTEVKLNPPHPTHFFMLNGRSLMLICMLSLKTVYDV